MKKLFRNCKRMLSLLLVLVLVVQIIPAQVLAEEIDTATTKPEEAIEDTVEEVIEPTTIGEIEELREEDVKHFMNADGSFTAVKYAEPVHFKEVEGDEWKDIDNTLCLSDGEAAKYKPENSPIDVEFEKEFSRDKIVTVHSVGYDLSWTYLQPDAETIDSIKDEVASGDVTVETENTQTSMVFPDIENAVEVKKLDQFSKNITEESIVSFAALDNISDGLVYCDVFPNVDIEYILDSAKLKENIVLKSSAAQNEFIAQYNIGELTANQIDKQNIELIDAKGNTIFCISAPCMYDANNASSGNVVLSLLSEDKGVIKVKIIADNEWLQDKNRAYPVKVDPNVFEAVQSFNQDATAIYKNIPSSSRPYGTLVIGNDNGNSYRKAKAYVKFDLPTLSPGDMVVGGKLYIHEYSGEYGYSGNVSSLQINAYKVLSSWSANTIETSSGYENLPSVSSTVVDYVKASTQTRGQTISFDISKVVKEWYEGTSSNYGICLRANDESAIALAQFVASDNPTYPNSRPYLLVNYRSNKGLEGYWSAHMQDLGESGVGYVNDYTGNLVFVAPLVSTTGNIMPVSLSLVYNGYQHGNDIDRPNTVGEGWRLNLQEKLTPITDSGGLQSKLYEMGYRYKYSDSDGTDHYFIRESENSSNIIDEDGLGLTLTVNSTVTDMEKYVITSDSGGKMTFTSSGYLRKVYDDNGNYYKIFYSDDPNRSGQIIRVEDGAGRKILVGSNANGRIETIQQQIASGSNYRTITLSYADWGGLRSITYPGSRTTTFYYTDSGVKLNKVDAINGNRLVYSYPSIGDSATKCRVIGITEYSSGSNREEGNSLAIDYSGMNRTVFTDNQGRKETYQFDNWGRTVNIRDADGHMDVYKYVNGNTGDTRKSSNALKSASVGHKYVINMLRNHSFENSNVWSLSSNAQYATDAYYLGTRSAKLSGSDAYATQTVDVLSGYNYYTFSAYVKTDASTTAPTVSMKFLDAADNTLSIVTSNPLNYTTDWQRLSVSAKIPDGTVSIRVRCMTDGMGNAWFDCAQLETGLNVNTYNLVENGNFNISGSTVWSLQNGSDGDGLKWDGSDGYYKLYGNSSAKKRVVQTIPVNRVGNKTFLTVSAQAKGTSVPLSNDRHFGIGVRANYTDGSQGSIRWINFNPDYSAGWQYATDTVGFQTSSTISYIEIFCAYENNANTASFDCVQVNLDETGVTYTYDEDGNLISAKDNAKRNETFTYNNTNDVTAATTANNKNYTFTYSTANKHQLIKATSATDSDHSTPKLEFSFGYDSYGNMTSTKVKNASGKYIQSNIYYTDNGNYISEVDSDSGYGTLYDFNTFKGTLRSVTDPEERTTYYTYDANNDRLLTASDSSNASSSSASSVTYGYNSKGYLSTLTTPSTSYSFTYDSFGNSKNVKVGGTTLVENTYEPNNGNLISAQYGNGFVVGYGYDSLDRVTSLKYNGNTKFEWGYNADGQLGRHKDYVDGKTYTYTYDALGRALRTDVSDGNWLQYSYNSIDQSTKLHYRYNGTNRTVSYAYSAPDNLPSSTTFCSNGKVSNSYDSMTRLSKTSYKIDDGDSGVSASYSYLNWTDAENRTTSTVRGIDYTYTSGLLTVPDLYYNYDESGNITSECLWSLSQDNPLREKYTYDSKNQLTRHDSKTQNASFVYSYDKAGNIKSVKRYAYTTETLGTVQETKTYTYGSSSWGDLLTNYNGNSISYDSIGNMTGYNGFTYNWNGRELAKIQGGGNTYTYKYNANGIRTSKTINGTRTEYFLNGSQILAAKTGDSVMWFFYDSQGNRVGLLCNGYLHYYIYNLQGDVIALARSTTGKIVARYSYDAWGNCTVQNASGWTVGDANPFRYRGYYYDTETGLYYLNSRYYSPEFGRFISADGQLNLDDGMTGYNLFCYGGNNPVNTVDPTGHAFMFLTAAIGAVVGAVAGGIIASTKGKNIWSGIGFGAAAGGLIGLGAGAAAGALITGSATASTAIVLGTASMKLAATGTTLGIGASKVVDKFANGYQKAKSVITGTTDIFRSVSAAELSDIRSTGQFNLPVGGMESKQFAFSCTEAMKFGNQPIINQTSIVRASVPNSMLNQFCSISVDAGIFTRGTMTVYGDMLGHFNQAVAGTIRIMP